MSRLFIVTKVVLPKRKIFFQEKNKSLTAILYQASVYSQVSIKNIKSESKKRKYTVARMLYLAYCYDYIDESLYNIASEVNRNHATTIYAHKNVQFTFLKEYKDFLNYMDYQGYRLEKVNREKYTTKV